MVCCDFSIHLCPQTLGIGSGHWWYHLFIHAIIDLLTSCVSDPRAERWNTVRGKTARVREIQWLRLRAFTAMSWIQFLQAVWHNQKERQPGSRVEVYLWRAYAGDPCVVGKHRNTLTTQIISCRSQNME